MQDNTLKFLDGHRVKLTGKLPAKDRFLPVSSDDSEVLLELLDEGEYSYMALRDGRALEVIRIENYCGRILITRGLEGTKTLSFRCGTCLGHILTPTGVKEYVCQNLTQLKECRDARV